MSLEHPKSPPNETDILEEQKKILGNFSRLIESHVLQLLEYRNEIFFSPMFAKEFKYKLQEIILKKYASSIDSIDVLVSKLLEDFPTQRTLAAGVIHTSVSLKSVIAENAEKISTAEWNFNFPGGLSPYFNVDIPVLFSLEEKPDIQPVITFKVRRDDSQFGKPLTVDVVVDSATFAQDETSYINLCPYLEAIGIAGIDPIVIDCTSGEEIISLQAFEKKAILARIIKIIQNNTERLDRKYMRAPLLADKNNLMVRTDFFNLQGILNTAIKEIDIDLNTQEILTAVIASLKKQFRQFEDYNPETIKKFVHLHTDILKRFGLYISLALISGLTVEYVFIEAKSENLLSHPAVEGMLGVDSLLLIVFLFLVAKNSRFIERTEKKVTHPEPEETFTVTRI